MIFLKIKLSIQKIFSGIKKNFNIKKTFNVFRSSFTFRVSHVDTIFFIFFGAWLGTAELWSMFSAVDRFYFGILYIASLHVFAVAVGICCFIACMTKKNKYVIIGLISSLSLLWVVSPLAQLFYLERNFVTAYGDGIIVGVLFLLWFLMNCFIKHKNIDDSTQGKG